MKFEMIVAHSKNNCIGNQNGLPWRLKDDMINFKRITEGGIVIMGRKTFESIGRPLADRLNIVLTRDESYSKEGVTVVYSKEEVLLMLREINSKIFIIGGAQIYNLFMEEIEEFHITEVQEDIEGDAYLGDTPWRDMKLIEEKKFLKNKDNEYDAIYRRYVKDNS